MNTNSVNNQAFQAKMPKIEPRVKVVGKVNGYIEQMLNEGNALIENSAKLNQATVRIAQKGDQVLINAGPKTSFFDYKAMSNSKDFYENILKNIRENSILRNPIK